MAVDDRDATPGPALLEVTGLSKSYDGRLVVPGIDLRLAAGTALALTGPNGSGKSTVLRCLSGHERCAPAAVTLPDGPASVHSRRYRSQVFPVFDDFALFPDVTVREHLEFLASLHGVADSAAAAREALAAFAVTGAAEQFPAALSSGQARRVAFAAAAIRPWRVLLLDEPEQRLDTDGQARLRQFLQERLEEGRGLVLATHDLDLVDALGAQVVALGGPAGDA